MPDPVSWFLIRPGWKVFAADGPEFGAVDEVAGDDNADIFDGLAIATSAFGKPRYVPSEQVGQIFEGEVHLTISREQAETLANISSRRRPPRSSPTQGRLRRVARLRSAGARGEGVRAHREARALDERLPADRVLLPPAVRVVTPGCETGAVQPRRAVPLVLAVAGLLVVAALASHGRPLTGSRGTGPTPRFFDYVFTTIALLAIAIAVVFLWSIVGTKWDRPQGRPVFGVRQFVVSLAASLLFAWLLFHAHFHFFAKTTTNKGAKTTKTAPGVAPHEPAPIGRRGAHLRWDEIAIVGALLAAAGVAAFASRKTKPAKEWRFRSHEDVALALDESLDDLRREPDLRRAIIAAYARMERALAAAGIPRRPSEAPLEFLARALQGLDASADGVTRLTDLFEWAKFSRTSLTRRCVTRRSPRSSRCATSCARPCEAAA